LIVNNLSTILFWIVTPDNSKIFAENICSICLTNQIDIRTICSHTFCSNCIYEWVNNHNSTCPFCRSILNKNNVDQEADVSDIPSNNSVENSPNVSDIFTHEYIQELRNSNTDTDTDSIRYRINLTEILEPVVLRLNFE